MSLKHFCSVVLAFIPSPITLEPLGEHIGQFCVRNSCIKGLESLNSRKYYRNKTYSPCTDTYWLLDIPCINCLYICFGKCISFSRTDGLTILLYNSLLKPSDHHLVSHQHTSRLNKCLEDFLVLFWFFCLTAALLLITILLLYPEIIQYIHISPHWVGARCNNFSN